jgi:hypothetical protein
MQELQIFIRALLTLLEREDGLVNPLVFGVSCLGRRGPRGDRAAWDYRLSRPPSWVCALLPGWDESEAKQPETEDEFF